MIWIEPCAGSLAVGLPVNAAGVNVHRAFTGQVRQGALFG